MEKWAAIKNQQMLNLKGSDETNDLVMRVMQTQKSGSNDLLQNCDLPPPRKVISSTINRRNISGLTVKQEDFDEGESKLGLLKALRLSQTRAREAEAKYAAIVKERDSISFAFMEDSMQIFAYRQLLKLLEFQVSQLQNQKAIQVYCNCQNGLKDQAGDDGGSDGVTWIMAVAFCLGIGGFGIAIGCKYCWF